jgi:hypothetical protein
LDSGEQGLGGWHLLHGCMLPGPLPSALVLVALHPRRGVVLIDMAPGVTPEAAPRLLARLARSGFGAIYGDALPPVLHLVLPEQDFPRLSRVLDEAFLGLPEMALPGGDAWMSTVARTLVPGLPPTAAPRPSAGRMRPRFRSSRPRLRRWQALLVLAVLMATAGLWMAW